MTTAELIDAMNSVAVGVRLPEGMEPKTVGADLWQQGVTDGMGAYKNFIGVLLDGYADAVAQLPDAIDLSQYATVVEACDDPIARLRARVDNTGDEDTDFEILATGSIADCERLQDFLIRFADAREEAKALV